MREQRNASASFSRNIISKIKNYLLKIEEKRINRWLIKDIFMEKRAAYSASSSIKHNSIFVDFFIHY